MAARLQTRRGAWAAYVFVTWYHSLRMRPADPHRGDLLHDWPVSWAFESCRVAIISGSLLVCLLTRGMYRNPKGAKSPTEMSMVCLMRTRAHIDTSHGCGNTTLAKLGTAAVQPP